MKIGNLEIDTNTHEVKRGSTSIISTPKEYAILKFLLYNKNRFVYRLSITGFVWSDNFDLFTIINFIDVHVKT